MLRFSLKLVRYPLNPLEKLLESRYEEKAGFAYQPNKGKHEKAQNDLRLAGCGQHRGNARVRSTFERRIGENAHAQIDG
ncbi:hypothetical protein GCM10025771_14210 [Niveibacterium umoris]